LHLANRTREALETVDEAEAVVERLEERGSSAELFRLRGIFLAAMGADTVQVETSLRRAIATAKEQKSTSLSRRAESSYAKYCRQR
jgi:hypothetical protein